MRKQQTLVALVTMALMFGVAAPGGASSAPLPLMLPCTAAATRAQPRVTRPKLPKLAPLRLPPLPLKTRGARIYDGENHEVKLASVNWYGAEEQDYIVGGLDLQPLDTIAKEIRALGFNTVRLPWSNALLHDDPVVCDTSVAANPRLRGRKALDVFGTVISALGRQGIMVVLDNHMTTADWCCPRTEENNNWYNAAPNRQTAPWLQRFSTAQWLEDWQTMVRRHSSRRYRNVIGADLRNEPRAAMWGSDGGSPSPPGCRPPDHVSNDWHDAAERGAACVLRANPKLLVIVEGVSYSLDLTGAAERPVRLPAGHGQQLVYSPHDYAEDHPADANADAARLGAELDRHWGYLAKGRQAVPVWVGEFGTCHTAELSCSDDRNRSGEWLANLARYLVGNRLGWSYWPLNGTQSRGVTRRYGDEETFGVLSADWNSSAQPALTKLLQSLPGATRHSELRC